MSPRWEVVQDPRAHAPGFPALTTRTLKWCGEAGALRFRKRYATRLHTASVYALPPRGTYTVLLAHAPRFAQRPSRYREWAPGLAPRRELAEALASGLLTWEAFASQYLAELNAFAAVLPEARARVADVLERFPSMTLLDTADERGEDALHCPRRVLRLWLLGEQFPELNKASLHQ